MLRSIPVLTVDLWKQVLQELWILHWAEKISTKAKLLYVPVWAMYAVHYIAAIFVPQLGSCKLLVYSFLWYSFRYS